MTSAEAVRIDIWLWRARFFKTRALAGALAQKGRIRIGSGPSLRVISKSSALVRPGDRLTFPQGKRIVCLDIIQLGTRRGPAIEAQALYTLVQDEDQT